MSFSNSGGTLALPSPTHGHHQMDVSSAVRTLGRSLSRSPSKFLSRTSSRSSDHSLPASPRTPSRRFVLTPKHQHRLAAAYPQSAPPAASAPTQSTISRTATSTPLQPPALTPLRPSVRLSLRSAKSTKTLSPARHLARRPSPKSPLKRTLSNTSDLNINPPPATLSSTLSSSLSSSSSSSSSPRTRMSPGQENTRASFSTIKSLEKPSRHSLHLDVTGASQAAFLKALDISPDCMVPPSGALKRSDATMNLDHPNQGSPVAKRRSMHGIAAFTNPESYSIFGSNTTSSQSFDIHEDLHSEYELSATPVATFHGDILPSRSPTCSVPKRSSSLRKSTLQQRSLGRRTGERPLSHFSSELSTPGRSRPRLSNDHFLPPQGPRDSPFSNASPLPNPSIHPMDAAAATTTTTTTTTAAKTHQPHPLSKTLTTSLSGNSLTEEEPAQYASVKPSFERPKPHPFSRSLPLNATRPTAKSTHDHSKAVATPNKSNLWVAAFNSTGLISKVNRNPEEEADKKVAPPDTPCKKHSNPFATFPPLASSGMRKRGASRSSFTGVPSTPFSAAPNRAPDTFGNVGKGMSIFQPRSSGLASRRGSVLRLDGEKCKLFDDYNALNGSTLDTDNPPTPTKNLMTPSLSNLSEQSLESPSAKRSYAFAPLSAVKQIPPRSSTASPIPRQRTPQTPQGAASRFAISQINEVAETTMPPPVTPTAARDFRSSTSIFVTPVNDRTSDVDIDASLYSKFDKVEQVGKGEFSTVYRVTKTSQNLFSTPRSVPCNLGLRQSPAQSQVYAVKKSRHPYNGHKDREVKLREARILQALSHAEHVVHYMDDWEHNLHLYIQTEFCEDGTLEKFLSNIGRQGRLDDFRIFKILQDLCLGLKEIHDAGFMHLDMKPANILINFEGALKIGDFGLAQPCSPSSSVSSVDIEGDREYMAPEMLKGEAGQPADVFSLGLITLEVAANVVLPDNGPTWIALRSGDLSEVPSLTWTPSHEAHRDASGDPLEAVHSGEFLGSKHSGGNVLDAFKQPKSGQQQPAFMVDAFHPSSLDSIVRWMTAQEPSDRACVNQILELDGIQWVAEHRNAPATVYEGSWGLQDLPPVSIVVDSDTEMTDA